LLMLAASVAATGSYTLPTLPYDYAALEPHFDAETMQIHHSKHHATYVAGLNAALPDGFGNDMAALAKFQASSHPATSVALRNHGGGHYNHAFFWVNLAPADKVGKPSRELAMAIENSFGSMEGLKTEFAKAAMGRFGSGWAWLGVKRDGTLAITSTANQDNPLMTNLEYPHEELVPILGLDVWEHAYYLKYRNVRANYVAAFWNVVNWNKVSRNYEKYAKHSHPVPATTTGTGLAIDEL